MSLCPHFRWFFSHGSKYARHSSLRWLQDLNLEALVVSTSLQRDTSWTHIFASQRLRFLIIGLTGGRRPNFDELLEIVEQCPNLEWLVVARRDCYSKSHIFEVHREADEIFTREIPGRHAHHLTTIYPQLFQLLRPLYECMWIDTYPNYSNDHFNYIP